MVDNIKINVIEPQVYTQLTGCGVKELLKCASAARVSRGKRVLYNFHGELVGHNMPRRATELEDYQKGLDLIDRLLRKKPAHESVLEHGNIRIDFHISRIATHQLVRHRNCAFTQESTRYVVTGKGNEVTLIKPMGRPDDELGSYVVDPMNFDDSLSNWMQIACSSIKASLIFTQYKYMTNEDARYMLPGSLASNISVTANLRQWRTMVKIRTHKTASPEMVYIFERVKDYLGSISPSLLIGLDNE